MSRPRGSGIPYFSHDTKHDMKIEYLEAIHGIIGYAVFFKLLEYIYGENGYYIEWSQKKCALFAKKNGVEKDEVDAIINTCFEENLFNYFLYEKYNILTSLSIQNRYKKATQKRVENDILPEYCATQNNANNAQNAEMRNAKVTQKNADLRKNSANAQFLTEETNKKEEESTQSKVKESKVKESIPPKSPTGDSVFSFDDFWILYDHKVDRSRCEKKYKRLSEIDRQKIRNHLPEYIQATPNKKYRKRPLTYLNGENWLDEELPITQQPDSRLDEVMRLYRKYSARIINLSQANAVKNKVAELFEQGETLESFDSNFSKIRSLGEIFQEFDDCIWNYEKLKSYSSAVSA